jgi:hypothetical protein
MLEQGEFYSCWNSHSIRHHGETGHPWIVKLGLAVSKAVSKAFEHRNRAAIDVLIAEVAKGKEEGIEFTEDDADEFVQTLLRFLSAVDAGAARQNLRLLAQVIFGLKRNKTFEYDKFSRWANILQTLTRNEILFLGAAYRLVKESSTQFWKKITEALSNNFSPHEFREVAAALTRTGLILPDSSGAIGASGIYYVASPALKELGQLAELEQASKDL